MSLFKNRKEIAKESGLFRALYLLIDVETGQLKGINPGVAPRGWEGRALGGVGFRLKECSWAGLEEPVIS